MNYIELNNAQRERMKQITSSTYTMEWEDSDFMDYLLGELPDVRKYPNNNDIPTEVSKEISLLEKKLAEYNSFNTDKALFLKEVGKLIERIQKKIPSWYGVSVYELEMFLKIHSCCLISGEGGIGKSYFLKCFEERLNDKNINHLCIYGKFEKDLSRIDVNEIIEASENGFVFICDAINEMTEDGQQQLLELLKILKGHSEIRIVFSYRNNTLDENILREFLKLADYEYRFGGVSFESALTEVLKLSVPDVYLYEDVLYSNNALLLSMLCDVLSSEKILNEEENGVASITFILEHYIKTSIGKCFKDNLTCRGIDVWKDTKLVAEWMFKNGKKQIDETSLLSVIKTGENFLKSMIQMGFMDAYERDNTKYYYFTIDSLTDFLLARSLFKEISGLGYSEKVEIIKSKVKSINSIEEPLIIAIFDNLSPDYAEIKKILIDTELIKSLDYNTLVKVHFKNEDIKSFQNEFKPLNQDELLPIMGGYTDKPFNCSNYLFNYYCSVENGKIKLSELLSGFYFNNAIKNRLKNVLYFTSLNDRDDRRDDETFYLSLLCCAAPNKDIRCLAIKILYEILSKNNSYIAKLITEFERISDLYIQEAVIYVLGQMNQNNEEIISFYKRIIINNDDLSAKSIRRISTYLGEKYSYIEWDRKDLYCYNENAVITDFLNDVLFYVDLMDKDFLPFRYWGKNRVDMYTCFLANNKNEIKNVNCYLTDNYSCVCGGACSGDFSFESRVKKEIESMAVIETMDVNSFMESLEKSIIYIFSMYNLSSNTYKNMREEDFHNSLYRKCIDIAVGLYYGSLMCNYYTNQFATYNNYQNSIGYEVFDPLEYGENLSITSPIPTYQDFIERLGDLLINSIELPHKKDMYWVRDIELTRKNVLHLLEPIKYKKQEWVLLAGRISLHEEDKNDTRWIDNYDIWCCSSDEESINNDGKARYLTIELEDYLGELKRYPENDIKPWLCKSMRNILNQSEVFEETSLVLPPSEIISHFGLKLNVSDLSWETVDGKKIIICNNNKNSYYHDPIGRTVFIRKDYLEDFIREHAFKYFIYTERFHPKTGFADETSLHFEVIGGQITKEINNYNGMDEHDTQEYSSSCDNCRHNIMAEDKLPSGSNDDRAYLEKLLKQYGA